MLSIEQNANKEISAGVFGQIFTCTVNNNDSFVIKKCSQGNRVTIGCLEPIITRSFNHPNIVKTYHAWYDKESNTVSCLMKRYRDNLREIFKLEPDQALRYIYGILQALRALEERCIIHGDLKPENILIDHVNNEAVVCDFGLSLMRIPIEGYEYRKICICSDVYRSPDIILKKDLTPKSDIWSLGCIAIEMCFHETKKRLFTVNHVESSIKCWADFTGQNFDYDFKNKEFKPDTFRMQEYNGITPEWERIKEIGKLMLVIDHEKRPSARDLLLKCFGKRTTLAPYTINYRAVKIVSEQELICARMVSKNKLGAVFPQLDYLFSAYREFYSCEDAAQLACIYFLAYTKGSFKSDLFSKSAYVEFRESLDKLSYLILPPS